MHEAREEAEWTRTAHILAGLYNIPPKIRGLFDKEGKMHEAEDFMPDHLRAAHKQRKRENIPRAPIGILKQVFVDRRVANVQRERSRHNGG